MSSLAKVVQSTSGPEELKTVLADFHVLCFIESTGIFSPDEFQEFCQLVTNKENHDLSQLNQMSSWNTLQMLLNEAGKKQKKIF